jgi:hypothetical protein
MKTMIKILKRHRDGVQQMTKGFSIQERTNRNGSVFTLRVRKKGHYFSGTYSYRGVATVEGYRISALIDAGKYPEEAA